MIIYLTNIEHDYFKHFILFDPFIFRRHPNLDENQELQLFIAMLNIFKKNESFSDSKKS